MVPFRACLGSNTGAQTRVLRSPAPVAGTRHARSLGGVGVGAQGALEVFRLAEALGHLV